MAWRNVAHTFRRDLSPDLRGAAQWWPWSRLPRRRARNGDGPRLLGDIELHLRARDWLAHGHHTDTALQSRDSACRARRRFQFLATHGWPRCPYRPPQLHPGADLSSAWLAMRRSLRAHWPHGAKIPSAVGRDRAFRDACARLQRCLSCAISDTSQGCWSAADRILWVALAEALGYGQHRDALRQAGIRLLAGNSLELDDARRSERIRLGGLLALWERWRVTGPWEPLRAALLAGPAAVIMALRVSGGAISAVARSHHGRECGLPVRGSAGDSDGRRIACRARACGVSGIAGSAIEPDYPRDDAAAWPDETPRRSGGAAGTASSLGQLVSCEGL